MLELAEGPLPNSRFLRPLRPQHCAHHRRPLSETRACPCRPGLRPPLGPDAVPSQHLSELDLRPHCPLGLCQSVTRDWADPGTAHQSPAQAGPDGSASAFQLPGCLVPHAGPCPEVTSCRIAPSRFGGGGGPWPTLKHSRLLITIDTCAQQ